MIKLTIHVFSLMICCHSLHAQVRFVDVVKEKGLSSIVPAELFGSGIAAADYDNDGDIDFYVTTEKGSGNRMYRNMGNGNFEEIAESIGIASKLRGRAAMWFDFDGDQKLDLFVAGDCYGDNKNCLTVARNVLYRQVSNTQFQDVTVSSGLTEILIRKTSSAFGGISVGDIDNDGFLDLLMTVWGGGLFLYLNQSDGTFKNITASSQLLRDNEHYWQPVMYDFNGDGYLDIYICRDFGRNELLINNQNNTFTNMAESLAVDNDFNDMGIAIGDFDNDEDMDLYISNIYGQDPYRHNVFFTNRSDQGTLMFTENANDLGMENGGWGWGVTFLDANNDGWLDLAATNGWERKEEVYNSKLWLNQQNGTFQDFSLQANFNDSLHATTLIAFDFDRDGDLDMVQTLKENSANTKGIRLLENQLNSANVGGNFIAILPRMLGTNHYAIGGVVKVKLKNEVMTRPILAGNSFYGQEPAEAFFGLGEATLVEEVQIAWPGGGITTVNNLPANQVLKIFNDDVLQIPINWRASVVDIGQIQFEWEHNSTVEDGFVIQKSATKTFNNVSEYLFDATARSYQSVDHTWQAYSYYRIASFNTDGRSSFGPAIEFKPLVTSVNEQNELSDLIISPNPSSQQFKIRFANAYIGNVKIAAYNTLGKKISSWNIIKNAAQFEGTINLKPEQGVYIISVLSGSVKMTKHVVVSF